MVLGYLFFFLHRKVRIRYSLEVPCQGVSNKYVQSKFYGETEKKKITELSSLLFDKASALGLKSDYYISFIQ